MQLKCGSKLYVFTQNPQNATANVTNANTKCVIDSHGFRPPTKKYFTVPAGVTVHFYVNRHAFLLVDGIRSLPNGAHNFPQCMDDIVQSVVAPVETIGSGSQCPDYLLSKQATQHMSKLGKLEIGWHHPVTSRYDDVGYTDYDNYLKPPSRHGFDVVSIRDRAMRLVFLSSVLKSFTKHGFTYSDVHCSFCRGGMVDAFKDVFGKGRDEKAGGRQG